MRGLLGPGWPAAAVGYVLVSLALVATGVSLIDVLVFSAYALGCLVLPGTLIWRAIAGDRPRPFVSDVVLGTCLAYAVELFWYIGVRAAGVPLLVLAWPVLVVGVSLLPRWRTRLWRPTEVYRLSARWSWGMTAIVTFAFAYVARVLWWPSPVTAEGLRFPYVDEPYHLSLVSELRHHFPVGSPVVDGEPLYYHWFLHAEVAASSWATGIEPVVLLQRLSLVPMIVLTLMGAAILAGRLARNDSLGLLAPAMITLAGSAQVTTSYGDPYLTAVLYLSPTTTFAQTLLVPILALGLTLLRADVPARLRAWAAMALVLAAVSAAKATVLPFVMAGFLGVVLLAALQRRLDRRALTLFAICAATFLLAQNLIFGSQSRGLRWDPLELSAGHAASAGLVPEPESAGIGILVLLLIVYLVQQLAFAAGMVGLVRHGRWRDPRAQFLVGAAAAGTGATFAFAANGYGQAYFFRTTPVVFAVAAVWGLSTMIPRPLPRRGPAVLVGAVLAGAGLALGVAALDAEGVVGLQARRSVVGLLEPYVLAGVGVLAVTATVLVVARRHPGWRVTTGPVVVLAILGLGLPTATGLALDVAEDPVPPAYAGAADTAVIGAGGIQTARWLRGHSSADDLVATNAHCRSTRVNGGCDNRMFWLSAYSERGILLEGWSYQVRTAPRALELDRSGCCLPFWDPPLLAANDAAFRAREAADVAALREDYGVQWMVVDLRSPNRVERLRRYGEQRYARGDYVVFELTSPRGG